MRVHVISNEAPPDPGNRARRVHDKARFLTEVGAEVVVWVPGSPEGGSATVDEAYETVRHGRIGDAARGWSAQPGRRASSERGLSRLLKGYAAWSVSVAYALRRRCAAGDVVLTMNNPLALHLAAIGRRTGVRWVAELRDPITGYETGRLGATAPLVNRYEQFVLEHADATMLRSGLQEDAETLRERYPRAAARIHQLPDYGVDLTRFADFRAPANGPRRSLRGIYAGSLYSGLPTAEVLAAVASRPSVSLGFVGDPPAAREALPVGVDWEPRIPFDALVDRYRQADFVLVLLASDIAGAQQWVPSKLCESIASRRPVLLVGPADHPLGDWLERERLGVFAEPTTGAIAAALDRLQRGTEALDAAWVDRNGEQIDSVRYERAALEVLQAL